MKLNGFIGPTYALDSKRFDVQRCINQYPMLSETGTSKSPSALRGTPGYDLFCSCGGGPVRGAITTGQGRAFVVSSRGFYEITAAGSTLKGTINTSTARVGMSENGVEVIVVDGQDGWLFNLTSGDFDQITDEDFPVCNTVTFQDGYFIVPQANSNNFYISGIYDGSTWDALDFSQAVSSPDNLVGCISDTGNLWLFGTLSVEVFSNTGAAQFPFERIPGAIIQTGCAAAFTIQSFDNTIAWLGVDAQGRGVVWKANGYHAVRMSNQAIESIIAQAPDFSESYAYVYHEQGHVFYCLQIKGLDTTLVYDGATGLWHERRYHDATTNTDQQHRASSHFFFNKRNYIGDRLTGAIYRQALDIYDYNGEPIHRERICPHIQQEKLNVPHGSLELDMETGKGPTDGTDPQVMLQYSDDGGFTWSNELWRSAGKLGEYKTRVRWSRLGSSRDRVYKVRYTENTFYQVNEAYLNAA